LYFNKF